MQRGWSKLDTANKIVNHRGTACTAWSYMKAMKNVIFTLHNKHNGLVIAPAPLPTHPASSAVDGAKSRTPCSNSVVDNCTRQINNPHGIHKLTITSQPLWLKWLHAPFMHAYAVLCSYAYAFFYMFTYVLSFLHTPLLHKLHHEVTWTVLSTALPSLLTSIKLNSAFVSCSDNWTSTSNCCNSLNWNSSEANRTLQ
jgi:hypothetical protein